MYLVQSRVPCARKVTYCPSWFLTSRQATHMQVTASLATTNYTGNAPRWTASTKSGASPNLIRRETTPLRQTKSPERGKATRRNLTALKSGGTRYRLDSTLVQALSNLREILLPVKSREMKHEKHSDPRLVYFLSGNSGASRTMTGATFTSRFAVSPYFQ